MNPSALAERTVVEPRDKHRILCVDDDPSVLSAIRRLLENEPYELFTTTNPDEALRRISQDKVSLLVADERMPGMSGTHLMELARRRSPATIRVILTGCPAVDWIPRAVNEGRIVRLMLKPWDDEEFKGTLRQLLHEKERDDTVGKAAEPAGGAVEAAHGELVLRVPCRGRTPTGLLDGLLKCMFEESQGCEHLVLVMDDLPEMAGVVLPFLSELFGHAIVAGLHTCILDRSGYASALLSVMGADLTSWAASIEAPCTSGIRRVLLAEAEAGSLRFVRGVVEALGHTAVVVNAATGLRSALRDRKLDLVLHDLADSGPGADLFGEGLAVPVAAVRVTPVVVGGMEGARLLIRRRIATSLCLSHHLGANRPAGI